MSRRALVLVHEPDGGAGRVGDRLRQRGVETVDHLITAGHDSPSATAPLPSIDGYDLLVLMGSIRSLTDKAPISSWIHDELALVRAAHESGTAVLGVCFGGQVIAEALGGAVETAPTTEIGWYHLDDGPDGPCPGGPGPWMSWHHDRFSPPPGADVLARTPDAIHLIRLGRTVGTQFHPEVDAAHVAGWLANATDDYLAGHGVSRRGLLDEARTHEARNITQCNAFVDWYLDEVAFGT